MNVNVYYIIMQAYYTKQVILCNFINAMTTSLLRQPFCYLKGVFFTFIHVVRMIFLPFYHIEIQFNIDSRLTGKIRPVSNCNFLPKSADCLSINGRPSPDALPMRKVMKKGGSFNETFNLFASTKKLSADQNLIPNRWKHRPTIDRHLQKPPTLIFAHRKSGDGRLG